MSLIVSVISLVLIFFRGTLYRYCIEEGHCWRFWNMFDGLDELLVPFILIFLLSLLTYKMPDEIFRAWWNFARWWVPVIIVVTLLLNNMSGTGGGYIGMGQNFINFIIGSLYAILIIVPLVNIVRAYNKK